MTVAQQVGKRPDPRQPYCSIFPGCIRAMSLCSARHLLCMLQLSDGDFPSHLSNEDRLPASVPKAVVQLTSTKFSSAQHKDNNFIVLPRSPRHLIAHVPQYLYKLILGKVKTPFKSKSTKDFQK